MTCNLFESMKNIMIKYSSENYIGKTFSLGFCLSGFNIHHIHILKQTCTKSQHTDEQGMFLFLFVVVVVFFFEFFFFFFFLHCSTLLVCLFFVFVFVFAYLVLVY